jgi:hypothetical protein
MNTVNLNLYQILKTDFKLSDAKAKEFVDAIREEVHNDIKYENSDFKSTVKEDFLKLELKFEQVNTKIESVKVEIKESKNDMLKWFVGMFFALALMIMGLYLKK